MSEFDGQNLPSTSKKPKLGTVFEKFRAQFQELDQLKRAYNSLCFDRRNPLIAQEITSCNAAAGYGINFSRASCETRPHADEIYPFGIIFTDAIMLLNNFFTKPDYVPNNKASRLLLEKLIQFLMDEDSHAALKRMQRTDLSKTGLMTVLAEHFFRKLSLSDLYTMDNSAKYKGLSLCKCGSCKPEYLSSCFGDTSVGNPDCWHGSLNILLGSMESFVHVAPVEEEIGPGGRTSIEVKHKSVEERGFRSQTLAQAIVFSFLQKQRHPNLDNFLIPCMAATRNELKIYFYDCKHDILLESRSINLLVEIPGSRCQVNYEAVLAAWLVLNYKFLCSGPPESLLEAPKANFFSLASSSLEMYEKDLAFKNVVAMNTFADYDFIDITKPKFVWPSDLPCQPLDSESN
ncbi:uncharacterized protein LOC134237946 [Saccostrea cucullata]|uniref:uncharacterized protein LOC134237946 n=1 Tax=Saccostrea cuccullata TaxID=36930 RepID=UPI002ED5B860